MFSLKNNEDKNLIKKVRPSPKKSIVKLTIIQP